MPSTTLPSSEDKNLVRRAVPTSKIFTAAVARLFVAYPNPQSWTYSNIWGAAVFLKDKSKSDSYFIRIVDLENHGGVIWEQELYEGFQYTQERPFFHTFDTDECQAGLLFVDDSEAETFYNKIINRQALASKAPPMATSAKVPRPSVIGGAKTKKIKGKVDKNSIGLPSEFRHLGHIGYTPEQGFSVQNNSPEWNGIFEQLKALGISADEINSNQDFIKDFVEQRGGPAASTPARPVGHTSPPPPPPPNNRKSPPVGGGGRRPPPPPPPRRSARPSGNTSAPPPPPAPPSLPSRQPPLPNRSNASPALPSRPPAGGAPPPPPPPPGMGGPPPPPPAPSGGPGGANAVPPEVFSGGRSDLMASIRGAGGIGTLRKTEGPREPSPLAAAGYEAGGAAGAAAGAAGGGDLASSLASALKQRANAMQSDDDEEEDNDDWED
ncbi:hypothetical protein INT43_006392 [Umbelopsis isabellina]|uniref:Uncharacterized protein n=1 Tax=Mortierella isabellina TaxID=91625 RepID=A0A8H7Q071_MORIS|nr:hypothetical protein INT43_006392 [Umbelopsis isabellina]